MRAKPDYQTRDQRLNKEDKRIHNSLCSYFSNQQDQKAEEIKGQDQRGNPAPQALDESTTRGSSDS